MRRKIWFALAICCIVAVTVVPPLTSVNLSATMDLWSKVFKNTSTKALNTAIIEPAGDDMGGPGFPT